MAQNKNTKGPDKVQKSPEKIKWLIPIGHKPLGLSSVYHRKNLVEGKGARKTETPLVREKKKVIGRKKPLFKRTQGIMTKLTNTWRKEQSSREWDE